MAGNEQELLVATAEPEECSRWVIICLLGCAGATVFGVSVFAFRNSNHLNLAALARFVLVLLGYFHSAACVILLIER